MNPYAIPGIKLCITPEQVISTTARAYLVTPAMMQERTRKSPLPEARQVAMYMMRELLELSWNDIGRRLNLDHSTAVYSYKTIKDRIAVDWRFSEKIKSITLLLNPF